MFVLDLRKFLSNKLTIIFFTLIIVLAILLIVIYTLNIKLNLSKGYIIQNILNRLGDKNNILTAKTYYAESEVTVVSNKNTNTYKMKEWYKKDVGNKVECLDTENSKVTIITKQNQTIINNANQLNSLYFNTSVINYTNVLSISTFIDIYNKSQKESCCFSATSYEKLNNINMILNKKDKVRKDCQCDFFKIASNVAKIELKVDKNLGIPLTYIVYDNDKKVCISIVYNKFDINTDIKNNIFKI